MYNYLLFLNAKAIKGYYNLKRALNGFDLLLLRKRDKDYIELYSRTDGLIKESY